MLLLDKQAFFLVSYSNVGAQIYELVAYSREEKNKFVQFCYLNSFTSKPVVRMPYILLLSHQQAWTLDA